uniref:Uncharacterized protein n=1 Tax=Nelumbo nucifera TaxID=4432 RepID=A0A822ZFY0_NELNU|nr:TPA_asm: hypothetical protein HUJ06_001723 [Nelumbo nucifera]
MPLMIGFEKDFSCHSHLGPIRIPPLFPFPLEPFPRNEKEDGTLELYYLSAYCLPKILLLQLVGHRVIQISRVFRGFPMLQLPYQFDRSGMDRLNIPLGSPVSRHMLPKRTQHLLPLEILVFHLTYFLLNSLKSSSDIHGYSKLFLADF